jgi:HPr kinase/phosphorylase
VIGGTEIDYLASLASTDARALGIATMLASEPACVIVCRGLAPPPQLESACRDSNVPLLGSALVTAELIAAITAWMAERFAPTTEVHGVLIEVIGVGVLATGKSGIGKSETALDLVVRGHRLVGDDVIAIRRSGNHVVGRSAGILAHHMEIRGLGIINVKDLFGIAAVRDTKRIELLIELREWSEHEEYDRLGFDDRSEELLGVPVAALRLPVRHGRNLATLVEVAARNQLLKLQGTHSARAFRDRLHAAMTGADATARTWSGEAE